MDPFHERLILRAATIDELLSEEFETSPGQKGDADAAARRLAAWCRAAASGDWLLFGRRLARDGLAIDQVLARFATARRRAAALPPAWIADAVWIEAALCGARPASAAPEASEFAFGHLLTPLADQAEQRLWASVAASARDRLNAAARACLRRLLLDDLCDLCAPALYERFAQARRQGAPPDQDGATARYDAFVAGMQGGGFRRLFEDKPVLLRLIAAITRQWLASSAEFVARLDADLPAIRRDILQAEGAGLVAGIEGHLSDPHHGGRSVLAVTFEDGARVVYKPKDLRLDAVWHALVTRMNQAGAPVRLRAARAIARDGYGWTEHIAHAGCADAEGCALFFRRAGAWLALFHGFATTDIHHQNIIAAGDQPVPIDLETILQAAAAADAAPEPEAQAFEAAKAIVAGSVMAVGLLPAYGRSADGGEVQEVGGVAADWTSGVRLGWSDRNADAMRPVMVPLQDAGRRTPNLPHVDGRYARLGDHIDGFIAGFEDYAAFLLAQGRGVDAGGVFDGFAGLPVRKVIRPTEFYSLLLHRLKNDRVMADGVLWSAQADFLARLADWDRQDDPAWPLQRAERAALVALNVPHFVLPCDGDELQDSAGIPVRTGAVPGLDRARARLRTLDAQEIAWQVQVIRQNTSFVSRSADAAPAAPPQRLLRADAAAAPEMFLAEADRAAEEISRHAIRRGAGAAWIGLGWQSDSEVSQLTVLGPDLYNGACGIALFLAAHAMVAGRAASAELARAAVAHLRKDLRGQGAARLARLQGTGGGAGMGSIVYTLAVMARLLRDDALLADARRAASLFGDDLIAADRQLDVIGGSAGAILGLLRLHRDTRSDQALERAVRCGEHLLSQDRVGPEGRRSWKRPGAGARALNGMSHGGAGFAHALASLAAATGREDFAAAASECIAFENASYAPEQANWPDFREAEPHWRSQWCHGAVGIGLARVAMLRRAGPDRDRLAVDIGNALTGAARGWPGHVDTLCCGSLGSVEFLCDAGAVLGRPDLRLLASRRLAAVLESAAAAGDYRWNGGERRFNLGLFRGLAGVGYACLRRVDATLPNVLVWE